MKYVFYDGLGVIVSELTAPNNTVADAQGGDYIETDESVAFDTHYVDVVTLGVLEKELGDFSYSVSGLVVLFSNAPNGTLFTVGNSSLLSDDLGLELEFDTPGIYVVNIDPPPQYKAEELEVTVG